MMDGGDGDGDGRDGDGDGYGDGDGDGDRLNAAETDTRALGKAGRRRPLDY